MSDRTWMTVSSRSSSFMGIIEISLKSMEDRVLFVTLLKLIFMLLLSTHSHNPC